MTTKELLNRLNQLREARGMKPLKAWKASKEKLHEAIASLEKVPAAIQDINVEEPMKYVTLTEIARELGMSPKVARAKMRRVFRSSGDTTFAKHTYPEVLKEKVITILKRDLRRKS
jgi:AraC-like DNA-binding protein